MTDDGGVCKEVGCESPDPETEKMKIDRSLNYGREQIRSMLQEMAPFRTVLDMGAGQGADLALAASVCPDAQLYAIEIYPKYATRLESMGITVLAQDIERDALPFEPGFIDVVIANQVLEHVKDIFWIFHEVTRILPIGGHLIVGVPNLAALHNRLLLLMGRQPSSLKAASAHVRGYTRGDLLHFLEICFPKGYVLEQFGGSNFYPFPPWLARPLAQLLPNMAWGIFFSLKKVRDYDDGFIRFPLEQSLETNFYLGPDRSGYAHRHAGSSNANP